ncbi:MAG: hypothetical protein IT262_02985 [Saprospiraceae bacterium]|nr:hypothetical protein [Saprospiraceae bacterium]
MKKVYFLILITVYCSVACTQTPLQNKTISGLNEKLQKGTLTLSEVLTNKEWMPLHSLTAFRNVIKENAKPGLVRLANADEPGLRMTVKGSVADKSGQPLSDALVYVYQTSDKGWYADTAAHIETSGSDFGHARLFGYLKTDAAGAFEFETIRPEGYPNSDLPAHIHIMFWSADGKVIRGLPEELLFEEDKRLTPERKKQALQSGYLVSQNTGTEAWAVYVYRLVKR